MLFFYSIYTSSSINVQTGGCGTFRHDEMFWLSDTSHWKTWLSVRGQHSIQG